MGDQALLPQSSLDSSSGHDTETPSSKASTSTTSVTSTISTTSTPSSLPGHARDGPCDLAGPGRTSPLAVSLQPPKCQCQEPPDQVKSHSVPLPATSDSSDPDLSSPGSQETSTCILTPQQNRSSKSRVTFDKEPDVPEWTWRLRPYLGYDWIAGSLDSASLVTDKSEAFFSKLQEFREANEEECVSSDPEPQWLSLRESSSSLAEDHRCVYCYRVDRRLFLVPTAPGAPCRLCRTPRAQRGPETLTEPAQLRVSLPLSVLEPPHSHRVHRRKSFDASDTLALPRHCLLGWDIVPPRPEKSSLPQNLDLWSCVSPEAQHWKPCTGSPACQALPARALLPSPLWVESQGTQPCGPWQKPWDPLPSLSLL